MSKLSQLVAAAAVLVLLTANSASAAVKPALQGFGDRSTTPKLALMNWYVVDAPISAMWDGIHGHALTANNPLDKALATGKYDIKLRAGRAGGAPTAMKTLAGFKPVTVVDAANGSSTTVGPFWRADYLALYAEYERLLAAKYDGNAHLRSVVISEESLVYDEPFRQYGSPGYTTAQFEASFAVVYQAHKVWTHTLQEEAFNPSAIGGVAFTLSQITAVRAVFGKQVVVGNNSLRATSMGTSYDQMYAAIKASGPPIYFQTATLARMGDPTTTFKLAVGYGANSVELPSGYSSIPASVLNAYQAKLLANPL